MTLELGWKEGSRRWVSGFPLRNRCIAGVKLVQDGFLSASRTDRPVRGQGWLGARRKMSTSNDVCLYFNKNIKFRLLWVFFHFAKFV